MRRLQVEELEPRQLLNGGGFSSRALSHSFGSDPFTSRLAERSHFVDFSGHAGPAGPGRSTEEGAGSGPSRPFASHSLNDRGPQPSGPRAPAALGPRGAGPEPQGVAARRVGIDSPGADGTPLTVTVGPGATRSAPPGPAGSSLETDAQPALRREALVAALGASAEVLGYAAARFSARTVRDGGRLGLRAVPAAAAVPASFLGVRSDPARDRPVGGAA
jgi:hypothetical protein